MIEIMAGLIGIGTIGVVLVLGYLAYGIVDLTKELIKLERGNRDE